MPHPASAAPPVQFVPPAYPYYGPPPKHNNTTLIIVLVVVLVITVPVVLAAVLYFMVSGIMTPGPGSSKPVVTFAAPVPVAGGEQLTIAGVSSSQTPSNYKVNLHVGTDTGVAVSAPIGSGAFYRAYVTVGFDSYGIEWTDIGGEGTVSAGDQYTVTIANGTWPSGATMTFLLLWSDGSLLAAVSWFTSSSKPVVAFTTPSPSGSGEALVVASVSLAVGPGNYRVNLLVGNISGTAVSMPTTGGGFVVLAVGGAFYRVNWTDIGGENTVNGGDSFTVTHTDSSGTTYLAMPSATFFTLYLLWSDGSQITSVAWSTY